jgi:hypothetical protein
MAMQTAAVARQWLNSDYVVTETVTKATVVQQQKNGVFCAIRAEMLKAGQVSRCHKVPSCPQCCTIYINDKPQTPGVYLGLFADGISIYATDRKEGYVLRKLQRDFSSTETRCERWNIKISEDKTQAIYFSQRLRLHEAHLILNERNIPFVNHVKYRGVIFDKRITWSLRIEMTEANAFRTFIRNYSLFRSAV